MIEAGNFIAGCVKNGWDFFCGVPCSFLKSLINAAIDSNRADYVAASSEGEAVGIAAGAYLGGRKAVVLCQNSGLGNTVNPLTSLNFPFRIPVLLIVSLRGEPGLGDEPQHELMGRITCALLDTIQIPWRWFPKDPNGLRPLLNEVSQAMAETGQSIALVMRKGSVAPQKLRGERRPMPGSAAEVGGCFTRPCSGRMSRMEAIGIIRGRLPERAAVIATTGKIGRELYTLGNGDSQLYVVGSMGCASGLGLGIQLVRPDQMTVVLDGDGAALLKMGTLATIGANRPEGLIHFILDNEVYGSTGGQATVSSSVDFSAVAAACGYRQCLRCDTPDDLGRAVDQVLSNPGPALIHVKAAPDAPPDLGRPKISPPEVKERFMRFLQRS